MATAKELLDKYYEIYHTNFSRSTLSKWVKDKKITVKELPIEKQKNNQKYDYDMESFLSVINSEEYKTKIRASKKKPKDFIGKRSGNLLITGIVPKNEYKTNYKGTLMYCKCLSCGKENIQIRFSYLSGNGNYTRRSCGCDRKKEAFKATNFVKDLEDDFIYSFDNFDKFLFIHRAIRQSLEHIYNITTDEYKNIINFFYNQKQFNDIYKFWLKQDKTSTFYDWAKPSLDHIIPKSKGGTNDITNLQFLTVFENLSKRDMTMEEWNRFKVKTNTKSDYFYENIKEVMP